MTPLALFILALVGKILEAIFPTIFAWVTREKPPTNIQDAQTPSDIKSGFTTFIARGLSGKQGRGDSKQ